MKTSNLEEAESNPEEVEEHQILRCLGGGATHLIGNETLDTIQLSYGS